MTIKQVIICDYCKNPVDLGFILTQLKDHPDSNANLFGDIERHFCNSKCLVNHYTEGKWEQISKELKV